METKCSKCGAEIPIESKFCMSCGVKVGKEKHPIHEPVHEIFEFLFSKNMIIAAIIFGVLFIWIGALIGTFGSDPTGFRAAQTLNFLGFFIVGGCLICGGIVNDNIDKFVRVGMTVMGVYMITMVLSVA